MDNIIEFTLKEDDHENGAIIIDPKIEGTHRIIGLIEGRDFEAQVFVQDNPNYEKLFFMNFYDENENKIEKDFSIILKENNLEVDVYGKVAFYYFKFIFIRIYLFKLKKKYEN